MVQYCKNICEHYNKVAKNLQTPKKYCRMCSYNIITNDLRCGCCKSVYRVSRKRWSKKPTGGKIGRPIKIPVMIQCLTLTTNIYPIKLDKI